MSILVMHIFTRPVCLALHTISFLASANFLSVLNYATATPIPLPLPLMAADRSLSPISVNRTIPHIAGRNLLSRPNVRSIKLHHHMKEHARRANASAELHAYYDRAKANSVKLSKQSVNLSEYFLSVNSEPRRQVGQRTRRRLRFSARFCFSTIRIQHQYAWLSDGSCSNCHWA